MIYHELHLIATQSQLQVDSSTNELCMWAKRAIGTVPWCIDGH
jgi:hypothetical protein